jgi:hypothetical protein
MKGDLLNHDVLLLVMVARTIIVFDDQGVPVVHKSESEE